jgi:hypothetical protein
LGVDKVTNHPGEWYALKALTKEMEALSPIFLSPTSEKDVMVSPRDDDVHLMLKDYKGESYLFAVNTSKTPKTLTFNIPGLKDKKKLKVISEDRETELINGRFRDSFEKYAVHIYTSARDVPQLRTIAEIERERKRIKSEHQKATAGNMILEHFLKGKIKLTVSSVVEDDLYNVSPWFAIDGLESTRWSGNGTDRGPQWLELDLGTVEEISSIVIRSPNGVRSEGFFVDEGKIVDSGLRDYKLQYWGKGKWITIKAVKGNTQKVATHKFTPVKTQKLRIFITATNSPGITIYEVEAYR